MNILTWTGADEGSILAAMEANMIGQMMFLPCRTPGMEVLDLEDTLLVNAGVPSNTFNCVARARFTGDAVDARIAFALEYFRSRSLPFAWWVGPGSLPALLGEHLVRAGLPLDETHEGMVIDLRRLPPLDSPARLDIQRVSTRAQLRQFATVVASIFTPPDPAVRDYYERTSLAALGQDLPLRFYLGCVAGEPVATSTLFVGSGIAGVYSIATVREARGQGIGTALTLTALHDAARDGYQIGTLQASTEGQELYARIGFRPIGTFSVHQ